MKTLQQKRKELTELNYKKNSSSFGLSKKEYRRWYYLSKICY